MNRTKKVCLLSDHHLCINPRLWKEAFFYEKEGYEVVVLTMWQSNDLLQRDYEILKGHTIEYKAYLNLIPGEINPIFRFFYRLRKRAAVELQRYLKIGTGWAISHAPELLVRKALNEQADMYAAHLECGFFAGRELVKAGKKVSFDFEDWYSRDYLSAERAVPLLSRLESFALEHGLFCTAASQAMAEALYQTYPSAKKITVIYNSFPETREIKKSATIPITGPFRLIWTSRTVGPKRGLETLVEAIRQLNSPVELHIIGKCVNGYEDFLKGQWPVNKNHKVIFYDFISHDDLMKMISDFDIGLAIENNEPDNKNKTISNKILQYLQSGIKVLATDTDGQREIAAFFPNSVSLVTPDQPDQWKGQFEAIIVKGRQTDCNDQLEIFKKNFSWPVQEQKLKKIISETL